MVCSLVVIRIMAHGEKNKFDQKTSFDIIIKIQPNTVDLSLRLWGIHPTNTISSYSPEPHTEVYSRFSPVM